MMSTYSMIDSVNFSVKNIYEMVDDYFDSPILEKIKDDSQVSIYMCHIKSMLACVEQRYIVAITNRDNKPVGFKTYLNNLEWKSLQTRMLIPDEKLNKIHKHSYNPKNNGNILKAVKVKERFDDHTDYYITDPEYKEIVITLLHKTTNLYEYPNSGTIGACLETYRTILVIN